MPFRAIPMEWFWGILPPCVVLCQFLYQSRTWLISICHSIVVDSELPTLFVVLPCGAEHHWSHQALTSIKSNTQNPPLHTCHLPENQHQRETQTFTALDPIQTFPSSSILNPSCAISFPCNQIILTNPNPSLTGADLEIFSWGATKIKLKNLEDSLFSHLHFFWYDLSYHLISGKTLFHLSWFR